MKPTKASIVRRVLCAIVAGVLVACSVDYNAEAATPTRTGGINRKATLGKGTKTTKTPEQAAAAKAMAERFYPSESPSPSAVEKAVIAGDHGLRDIDRIAEALEKQAALAGGLQPSSMQPVGALRRSSKESFNGVVLGSSRDQRDHEEGWPSASSDLKDYCREKAQKLYDLGREHLEAGRVRDARGSLAAAHIALKEAEKHSRRYSKAIRLENEVETEELRQLQKKIDDLYRSLRLDPDVPPQHELRSGLTESRFDRLMGATYMMLEFRV